LSPRRQAKNALHYIQHWLKTEKEIPNQSAARIFAAATSILKAGTPATRLLGPFICHAPEFDHPLTR